MYEIERELHDEMQSENVNDETQSNSLLGVSILPTSTYIKFFLRLFILILVLLLSFFYLTLYTAKKKGHYGNSMKCFMTRIS